ncbi:MAG: D-alanyl-D-alanine carboxypeptidase/D-alanyl-D-alanine-endopeptidase [Pyrinomonadaceae bacterium]
MKFYRRPIIYIFTLLFLLIAIYAPGGVSARFSGSRSASPTPTPKSVSSPVPKPTSAPFASPSPTATPVPIQTIDGLQTKIRQRIFSPEVRRGRIGIKIVSLNSGKVIFENDSDKYYMPASNMKNFTVAAALERLGPDFKFVTSVFAASLPDMTGTVKGDLRIYGRGDISISTAFFGTSATDPETYYKGIDRLADKIVAAGVKRIEGSIVGDEGYFKGFALPPTWEWDDLQWYYGAEISALPVNDNAVDLAITSGPLSGPCAVTITPQNTLYQITNTCTTTSASIKRSLTIDKRLDRNVLEISGTMPVGDPGFRGALSLTHPADLFVTLLKRRLELKGVVITGGVRTLPPSAKVDVAQIEIAKLESPPFSVIAAKTLKPSQNMYTETILWTLGEEIGRRNGGSGESGQLGLSVVKAFMKQIGAPDDGIVQYDGSGLSRHDLITPSAVVTLYTYMAKQSKYAQAWRDSLTIGGVDGTLANRFKGTAAAGNIRGKTGTIDQVSALSGYLTTAGGEQVVVSFVVNGVPVPSQRTSLIDDIVIQLANFNGKID